MDSIIKKFRISEGSELKLEDHDTSYSGKYEKEDSADVLEKLKEQMKELQEKLYINKKHAVLIIFQAMDAAGKDSAIEHVMSGLNPQGCEVYSFKQPTTEDYLHDFLWRHYKALPEKSRFGIHNRSHYENVLVCKVHPDLIMKESPAGYKNTKDIDEKFWEQRYESIRNFEKHLSLNGTVIIKFFLNVSQNEQKKRFLERSENPAKNWKFSSLDLKERELWSDYMRAYEEAITETTAEHAPWYVIPADKKWFSRIAISQIILETLKSLDLSPPELSKEEKTKLADYKKILKEEN
jgi:PPK2 family polyphosphate:nucleotide phosphotransferase